ncbi:branched-chain amino acid aminotransferase [Streptomyces canus]|uniref:branched-chain amino acid aminotransferase n=1 Tax=Streptomyces canus TaxID=58343 RepID=UPI0022550702|nr:branched-chain amino acid aminotransferase [Streptomyces canus]MCX5252606.1 branched-chain amino acid aminotransferase [Streptomyces canus]
MDFEIHTSDRPVPDRERESVLGSPGFGRTFTDHMVTVRFDEERGWYDGRLEAYAPISLDPSASVFHYGQECFEGMKAYRQDGGGIALFRPSVNARRFNRSAERLAMPAIPEETFLQALELLVAHDEAWVPSGEGESLYLRPLMIATQHELGFTLPSRSYLFVVFASPATAYFGAGERLRPLTVWLSEEYTRAAPGGTGAAKVGGNYAAAFAAQRQGVAEGCDQVVWLDAAEHTWVEEMGGMNIFFVLREEDGSRPRIVTPPLTDTLLPGVTRDSLLRLAPGLGLDAEERPMSVPQWEELCASGRMTEAFACGTAAVIAPIGRVKGAGGKGWTIGDGEPGPVTRRLRKELLDIQYGRLPDPHAWVYKVG